MQLKNQELAVIKKALKVALEHDAHQQASYSYREVLAKLANIPSAEQPEAGDESFAAFHDGFRYDYDDAADG